MSGFTANSQRDNGWVVYQALLQTRKILNETRRSEINDWLAHGSWFVSLWRRYPIHTHYWRNKDIIMTNGMYVYICIVCIILSSSIIIERTCRAWRSIKRIIGFEFGVFNLRIWAQSITDRSWSNNPKIQKNQLRSERVGADLYQPVPSLWSSIFLLSFIWSSAERSAAARRHVSCTSLFSSVILYTESPLLIK